MVHRKKPIKLQTKIIVLILSIIIPIVILISTVFFYMEKSEIRENTGTRALQFAKTISYMPQVMEGMQSEAPSEVLQPLMLKVQKEIDAEFIVIGDAEGVRYAHPDPAKIGLPMVGGDNAGALEEGRAYVSEATGSLGESLRGKSPILNDAGEIIGVVSVGFLIENVEKRTEEKLMNILALALIATGIGITGGFLLAKSIRRDIHGLEPHEIGAIFRERNAILHSVKEGIIAIDVNGSITMINPSAQEILDIKEEELIHKNITEILPDSDILDVVQSGEPQENKEIVMLNKHVIVNRIPILEQGKVVGVVSSFRDKTDMKKLMHTLVEVRKYTDELRAQTHEFTNKLYVISGMLELGKYEEAQKWIQEEYKVHQEQQHILFDQMEDEKLQAILLGKLAVASEKKVRLHLDEDCSIGEIPSHISLSSLVTIVGNLLDNAMEAVEAEEHGVVTFFAIDYGKELIIEVSDNGPGFPEELLDRLFERGFSTKTEKATRGYGLSIVQQEVKQLKGSLEVQRSKDNKTIFSVYLPKTKEG